MFHSIFCSFHISIVSLEMLFVFILQAFQYGAALLGTGLGQVDLLKTARQGAIFVEEVAILFVGGGADAAQLAGAKHRFEDIRGIETATTGGAGADNGVNFINKQNGAVAFFQRPDNGFETLFKIAAKFGARQQCSHIQRKNFTVL